MPSTALSHRQSWPKALASLPLFKQVIGLLWFSLYIVTLLSLLSYDQGDLGFNSYPPNPNPSNFIGDVGAGLAGMLYFGFGFGAYLFPLLALCCCGASFFGIEIKWKWKPVWLLLFLASSCALLDLQPMGQTLIRHLANIDSPGGLLGGYIIYLTVPYALGSVGAGVLFATLFGISAIYLFNVNPVMTALNAFSWYREWKIRSEEERLSKAPPKEKLEAQHKRIRNQIEELSKKAALDPDAPVIDPPPPPRFNIRRPDDEDEEEEPAAPPPPPPVAPPKPAPPAAKKNDAALVPAPAVTHPDYVLPSLQLLSAPAGRARDAGLSEDQLNRNLALIIETLKRFGVKAEGREITPGATITRYEVFPGEGVRVDKIASLKRDLSRVLCAERINILAPIPGKDTVGIEIANSSKVAVFLRELLESKDWKNTSAKIPIALGKDVYGKTLVADLAAMPHLLIGGTTGSGKSVCINCILMSFLFRFTPDELRLILIDPKQVEMQVYNAIPHLVVPVVTDPKKVMLALRWVINEMEKRYRILAKVGVRNIAGFNSRSRTAAPQPAAESPQLEFLHVNIDDESGEDEGDADAPQAPPIRVPREDDLIIPDRLPYIVVIVDELADLMQTAPADVESAVARLTAKARAAGIHLIVATQTPRREVVTGVIKTNIPARIAFQVPSGLDSRVILDENGAENLLGKGDLLYRPPGMAGFTRGQGAFVSDQEVQHVVDFAGSQGEAQFAPELDAKLSGKAPAEMEVSEEDKKLIHECFDVIRQERKASTSNLQRRLRLGYNRAAYVIDYLERIGVLGPADGAKPREILVDLESYTLDL
ncbi:MAG: DNA translocase FtsK 4TM domain-containing protein [Methylacidiphilales bacterium]|nr:DNA translocase FtsK 4TM domain-containing protein [Candidatus Methylacidiphilales bacterium]